MNINDIDPKIAAAVLRRQQEIGMEYAAIGMAERLRDQNVPEFLLEKVINYTTQLMKDSASELDNIMKEFESGDINFDDTVLKVMRFSLDLSKQSAKDIDEIIRQTIVSGELEAHYKAAGEDNGTDNQEN